MDLLNSTVDDEQGFDSQVSLKYDAFVRFLRISLGPIHFVRCEDVPYCTV